MNFLFDDGKKWGPAEFVMIRSRIQICNFFSQEK